MRIAPCILLAAIAGAVCAQPQPIQLPSRGSFYTDPSTGNRVWRVTDAQLCPGGAFHYYSYWPVWNRDSSLLLVACHRGRSQEAILLRGADFSEVKTNLRGPALNPQRFFWSWTDANVAYAQNPSEIWRWEPLRGKGSRIVGLPNEKVGGLDVYHIRLAYVSFDDRYLLIEWQGPNRARGRQNEWDVLAIAVFDLQTKKYVSQLDVSQWSYYDEAVFTKDNHVWVVGDKESFVYDLALSTRTRIADHGHHAHGLLPDGTAVTAKAASNQSCPGGSKAGSPKDEGYPAQGWKPTALVLKDLTPQDSKGTGPFPAELFRIGCQVQGKHDFSHFSWNNQQRDRFFVSTWGYGGFTDDPLANAILRVRLGFDSAGKIISDDMEVLAHHRSENRGYYASPRASCNQQGTRCLFASTMTVATDNTNPQPQLYVVDVPQK